MEVTDIRVRVVNREEKMRGVVSVTFDDCFVVHDIKIIDGEKGLFVAMPSKKVGEGEYRDIAHPINAEMRNKIESQVIEAYEKVLEQVTV